MGEPAIRIQELGKRYRIGKVSAPRSKGMRSWMALASSPFRYLAESFRGPTEEELIWALRDVSMDLKVGEVVGIIGRNGAGKSTLLKILSRVIEPTTGTAELYGRVASLLEVGTGFHQDLTGRENIFMNGALLGMSRLEIHGRLDEIVAFSGIEKFIDTPVKRYSSGMYVRLAFAVAAHLEAEILLVDEVLAVGDAVFQKKCLGRMAEVAQSGRTVVFVSHNMPAVSRQCERAILLDEGRVVADGATAGTIEKYMGGVSGGTSERCWRDPAQAPGDEEVRISSVRVVDRSLGTTSMIDVREAVGIETVFEVLGDQVCVVPGVALWNDQGVHIFNSIDTNPAWNHKCGKGNFTSIAWIPGNLLNEGAHFASALILSVVPAGKTIVHAAARDAVSFQVYDPMEEGSSRAAHRRQWGGAVSPLLEWTTRIDPKEPDRSPRWANQKGSEKVRKYADERQ